MDSAELGRKIKEARIAKKMTQAEVVGDYITRNMLSQIESGAACPSIKTLEYLAKVLELPSILMFSGESEANTTSNTNFSAFLAGKRAYIENDYEKAIELLKPIAIETDSFYDEACAILAMCGINLAKKAKAEANAKEGLRYAALAEKYADMGIYSGREAKTAAILLTDELSEFLAK